MRRVTTGCLSLTLVLFTGAVVTDCLATSTAVVTYALVLHISQRKKQHLFTQGHQPIVYELSRIRGSGGYSSPIPLKPAIIAAPFPSLTGKIGSLG
jgi:hypothetical protein